IDNKNEKISPGTTGKIAMKETKVKKGLLVPTEAVLQEADENFVYIVQDGKAKKIMVEVIETQTEYTAIKGDVDTKDAVIVNGHFVYNVQDDNGKKIMVEVIETQTEYTAIKGDVNTKDEVIVNGHFTLTDGSEVEVIKDGNDK